MNNQEPKLTLEQMKAFAFDLRNEIDAKTEQLKKVYAIIVEEMNKLRKESPKKEKVTQDKLASKNEKKS